MKAARELRQLMIASERAQDIVVGNLLVNRHEKKNQEKSQDHVKSDIEIESFLHCISAR